MALALVAAGALSLGAAAAQPMPGAPGAMAVDLDRFARSVGPMCERAPAAQCVDAGFRYADLNRDGRLSVPELERVRAAVGDWMTWKGSSLSEDEQTRIAFGIMIVDTLGIPAIVQSYDQDGDGALTEHEMLADVRLDRRPLGDVLADPGSVNRASLQRRLGVMGAMTDNIFAP